MFEVFFDIYVSLPLLPELTPPHSVFVYQYVNNITTEREQLQSLI
jgi:hypothetical protein